MSALIIHPVVEKYKLCGHKTTRGSYVVPGYDGHNISHAPATPYDTSTYDKCFVQSFDGVSVFLRFFRIRCDAVRCDLSRRDKIRVNKKKSATWSTYELGQPKNGQCFLRL